MARSGDRTWSDVNRIDVAPGRDVEGYLIQEEISRGGMGVVYRATQRALSREVALKVNLAADPRRFRREARSLARVSHPRIPRIFEFGEMRDAVFSAMELVRGESLARIVRRGPLASAKAARIAAEVARALGQAHAGGVLHRDVKAENIVVDENGSPWLVDFGLGVAFGEEGDAAERLTRTGEVLGTLAYLSPEHAEGRSRSLDARTDVYALGVTLYHALTQSFPYPASSVFELLDLFASGHRPDPRNVVPGTPAPLVRIVRQAMALDAGQRYATAIAMAEDLERFLADLRVHARASGVWTPRRNPSRRRRLVSIAAGGLVLVLGVGAGGILATRGAPPEEESGRDQVEVAATSSPAAEPAESPAAFSPSVECVRRGRAHLNAAEYQEALGQFEAAVALDPQSTEAWWGRGRAHQYLDDAAAAERDFTEVLRRDPDMLRALVDRASLRGGSGDFEGAREDLDRAILLHPETTEARMMRCGLRHAAGDREGALEDIEAALEADPGSLEAVRERASLRREVGDWDLALADCHRALELAQRSENPHGERASIYRDMGEPELAIQELDRAIELDPDIEDNYFSRGVGHRDCGRLEKAIDDLGVAVRMRPREIRYRVALVNALMDAGRLREALDHVREAKPYASGKAAETLRLAEEVLIPRVGE